MTTIPILKGIYATSIAEFRDSLPKNLEPTLSDSGISSGYLRTAPGLTLIGTGPGADWGGINWVGTCFRVMGSDLVTVITSTITDLGSVNGASPVSMDYSFDRLAIASSRSLYYWDNTSISVVTDPDLGIVLDVIWIDGYFMTTDGTSLVVTELNDPYAVNPLKYGSSEEDPDPVVALKKVRGEVYALNRYTIENFQNVGGNGFPFQRNPGGLIPKGCVGTHANCYFLESFAFIGSGRNEALSVYLAGAGQSLPMSTSEIDAELAALSPDEQANIEIEARIDKFEQRLLVHLPSKTLVYNHQASRANGDAGAVWHILASGVAADQPYVGKHLVQAEGRWIIGSPTGQVGYLDDGVETHFGAVAGWRFDTTFIFNQGRGGIVKSLELFGLPGRAPFGTNPTAFNSITRDGQTWSTEQAISMGRTGERRKRVQWRPKMKFNTYVGFRFRGANTSVAAWARLEGEFEGLSV